MMTKLVLGVTTALAAASLPSIAFAEGAVKVECWGRCDLVNLGQVCDSYSAGTQPVAIACDDTAFGSGSDTTCGSATCRPFGSIFRSDLLSAYCEDGPGYDAIVTCDIPAGLAHQPAPPKLDDGAGETQRE